MKHSSKLAFILPSNWQGWLLRGVSASLLIVILAVTGAAGAEEQSGFSSQPQNGASETVVQESEKLGTNELSSESVSPPNRWRRRIPLPQVTASQADTTQLMS